MMYVLFLGGHQWLLMLRRLCYKVKLIQQSLTLLFSKLLGCCCATGNISMAIAADAVAAIPHFKFNEVIIKSNTA